MYTNNIFLSKKNLKEGSLTKYWGFLREFKFLFFEIAPLK